ncbi:hypothetical protein OBBRIDRAFT_359785 [Obba rivulosa]|uniref:Uncharacterized protein n=1 Tax=Obba rivulosa TaxID=1052685 RepID=A0A8E2DUS7_9APHY|nr:hypothetical protein OBBRIDRAFT_359785 [Obba rivulosa]
MRKTRCHSTSEIARNVKNFETWSTYQHCEEAAYKDMPDELEPDIKKVFNVHRKLPAEWMDQSCEAYQSLKSYVTADFLDFLDNAYHASPKLFSPKVLAKDSQDLLSDIQCVYAAWKRLQKMRSSSRRWSEADYVANVYNVFRSPALNESDYRAQCSMSLPQPLSDNALTLKAIKSLNAKTASPDGAIFIPTRFIRELSHSSTSPYKLLKTHPNVADSGSAGGESSFRYQSTPCANLPDTATFEFASAFWEDKKPLHHMLEDAYRQNRMATTAAVRQLHSLNVQAPIFGLVWSQGKVRAHVDWWTVKPDAAYPTVRSAAYPGRKGDRRRTSGIFHEWNLEEPNDMLEVFLLIRNIDRWTIGRFRERVIAGVNQLCDDVIQGRHQFQPWKRRGDLAQLIYDGPASLDSTVQPAAPPTRRSKRR